MAGIQPLQLWHGPSLPSWRAGDIWDSAGQPLLAGPLIWARSEGLEPPTFGSVARSEVSRVVLDRRPALLLAHMEGDRFQSHPRSSRSIVSKSVSKIGSLGSRILGLPGHKPQPH